MSVFFLVLSVIFIALHVSQLANNEHLPVKDNVFPIVLLVLWGINFGINLTIVLSSLVV